MYNAVLDHNRAVWGSMVRQGHHFAEPAPAEAFRDPLAAIDTRGWLGGSVAGKRVLCLAAGGGRYSVLFAAAGAVVTVVDLCREMLALDRQVAAEHRLAVRTVEASMDDLSALGGEMFDIVAQPVSTCYVPDIRAVYRAVARVTVPGGLYISQHKQPASLQAALHPSAGGYELVEPYYRAGPLPAVSGSRHREEGTLEFLHRWEDLVGGLCQSGFVVEDLVEPCHAEPQAVPGQFAHRSRYVAPYVRIKARRTGAPLVAESGSLQRAVPPLWTPSSP
jgi:SAM-dependent methyltransferase